MIGRVYTWRGVYWLVVRRWAGAGPRNVLIERVQPWRGVGMGSHWFQCVNGRWWRPDARVWMGQSGEMVVRPFRGLRRVAL